MIMIENLYDLAVSENIKRKEALIDILNENNIPFVSQKGVVSGESVENIIVRLGTSKKRLVVGAHYDTVKSSTGANDNASGVLVLIELAKALFHHSPFPDIDIAFFDLEEDEGRGSKLYIEKVGKENIPAMINFDICGVGNYILAAPKKNADKGIFYDVFTKSDMKRHKYELIEALPPGDDKVFETEGILTLSICILDSSDVSAMKVLFEGEKEVTIEDYPSIIETMHNGPRDNVNVISEQSIKKVYEFTHDLVINCLYK